MSWVSTLSQKIMTYLPRSYTPLLLFLFGVSVTLVTAYFIITILDEKEAAIFANSVTRTESIITDYVGMYGVMLRSTKGLFLVDDEVSKSDFSTFIDQLRIPERYPGILGLGYVTVFANAEQQRVAAELRNLGVEHWQLYPEGTRDEYASIVYISPSDEFNDKAVGFDMFTDATRRTAMEQARDTGSLTLSGKITLVQEADQSKQSFLMYLPLYRRGVSATATEQRREHLVGFVYAAFRASDFFTSVLNNEDSTSLIDVTVYDGPNTRSNHLLYTSKTSDRYQPIHATINRIEVAGHVWTIVYTNKPEFEVIARRELVIFLIVGGLLCSMLLFIVSKKQVDARTRAEESEKLLLASQEELQASEERFRLLVESAQDYAIMHLDPQGRINSWNVGAEKMFGYTEEEILHQHFSIFFTQEDVQGGFPERELQRVLRYGNSEDENWLVRKDGSYFWGSGSSTAIYDEQNQLLGIAKIARDLSLRKKTEEVLRKNEALTQAVLQSLPTFIVVLDQTGKIIAINEAGTGEGSLRTEFLKEVQLRKNYLELMKRFTTIDIATRRKIIAGTQAVLEEKKSDFKIEYPVAQDGVEVWLLLQVTPLKYSGSGVVISHTDITERKNLEKQKDEFISIASHELKTPITSIKAYVQVLQSFLVKLENEKFTKIIGRVDKQVTKLASLVTDLLDVSKVESGQLQFNYEIFDFDTLVKETVETMQLTTQTHTIRVTGKTNMQVNADRERVGQVMVNLLSNAIKYSPNAKEVLVNCAVAKQEKGNIVRFLVTDFGVGIPKHQQKRIFERFYRANVSSTFSGLGLGLYISAQIIKRLGGKIGVENSAQGKGSTFFFILPMQ